MKDAFTVTYPIENGVTTEGFYQEVALDSPNGIASVNLIGNYPPLNVGDKVIIMTGDGEMNLQEEIKSLKERIAELEAEVQQEDEFPKDGDVYWTIAPNGNVFGDDWIHSKYNQDQLEIGNVFRTEEEAIFAVEKLKVEAELRKFSKPFDSESICWFIIFINNKIRIYCDTYYRQGAIYFESTDKANQAIEIVGEDRIKKYIFGVED